MGIIEVNTVELEELDQEHAEVGIARPRVLSRMELEKTDNHQDQGVGGQSSTIDFVEVSLQKELFQDVDQPREEGVAFLEMLDQLGRAEAVGGIEANV